VRANSRGITLLELMVVMALIALIAGLSYPSVARGLDSVRLRTASDDVAAFVGTAMSEVERTESPVELRFSRNDGVIEVAGPATPARTLRLPDGVSMAGVSPSVAGMPDNERRMMLLPGGGLPRLSVELASRNGMHRWITIEPVTGMPLVEDRAPAREENPE
jgi:prepilin-type N-terminal cleavage/methylation domain-containing protein